jgi:hypothetical protein
VERAGALAGTERFGEHAWYKEGVDWLLANQNKVGSWGGYAAAMRVVLAERQPAQNVPQIHDEGKRIADTAWAILFLRRATKGLTRNLVYSGPSGGPRETKPLDAKKEKGKSGEGTQDAKAEPGAKKDAGDERAAEGVNKDTVDRKAAEGEKKDDQTSP